MKNTCRLAILGFILLILPASCKGDTDPDSQQVNPVKGQKVVVYFPSWKMPSSIQWNKITHVCLAFGLVNADGTLNVKDADKMTTAIRQAHENNVQALLSIGGGGSQNFTSAILNESYRKTLITQLVAITKEMQLDGIDVDYEEWDGGDGGVGAQDLLRRSALENLYKELRDKLPKGKLITVAVNADWDDGGWGFYNCFNNTMHKYLDFVSLMIYDETGPWSGEHTGPHSGWSFFENSINHWLNNRQLPKEKLVAGVPFYGYQFQAPNRAEGAQSIPYKDILALNPTVEAHLLDSIGLLYYDGMPTMRKKSEYIKENKLGGIMVWEVTQDSTDPAKSLLNVIDEVMNPKK